MPYKTKHSDVTMGSRGGAVVRAFASHQCGPGSNPGVDAICGLSLLLVLSLAPRGFSPGLRFSPLLKNQHFQIPIRSGMHGHVSTSSYELLSAPWVNKLQFTIFFYWWSIAGLCIAFIAILMNSCKNACYVGYFQHKFLFQLLLCVP